MVNHRPIDPAEFMWARHPNLFSDASTETELQLPREVLDYHLETLTNRNQETKFEHFARLLSEKEICPNLRPQTGPTGGGDSKVDSETYPVANEIAERWYVGEANSAQERWAFAFSAKKTWTTKARSDVANILSTDRSYDQVYFITSRYARDKKRAEIEDELSQKIGVPVTILDRSWILEKVYENDRLDLAIKALGITGFSENKSTRLGPRDTAREAELKELDQQISDPERYVGTPYPLAEDCLRSALLARGLERPRAEVEARLSQAAQIATKASYPQQLLRIAYNRAWTAFWWYEDIAEFIRFYDDVENHASGSAQASDLELIFNLWQLLGPRVQQGKITAKAAKMTQRTARLKGELERLSADSSRPNNALQARTNLTLMKIAPSLVAGNQTALDRIWKNFGEIVSEAELLGNYPMEHLFYLIEELVKYLPDSKALDQLLDDLIEAMERRRSEGVGGKAYIKRGIRKLENNKIYEAIRMLGRAEDRLIKEEYREDLILALIAANYAYERAGLLWAARSKVLAAANISLLKFSEKGEVTRQALKVLQRLAWLEIQLGRLPQLLTTLHFSSIVETHLNLSDHEKTQLTDERLMQDRVLGILLLNATIEQLKDLEKLPNTLERFGLVSACFALLWALGHEDKLREEGFIPAEESTQGLQEFFSQWDNQPTKADLPPVPNLMVGEYVSLRTIILGCEFTVNAANNLTSVCIAESFLGALECFLSTSLGSRVMPYREKLTIEVRPATEKDTKLFLSWNEENGRTTEACITHPMPLQFGFHEDLIAYNEWLRDLLIQVITKIAIIDDPESWLEKIAGEEVGFSRAISLGNTLIMTENIFGNTPKFSLESWIDAKANRYPVLRSEVWNKQLEAGSSDEKRTPQPSKGPLPEGLFDIEKMKHSDLKISSVINIPLWDKARWGGTGFADYGSSYPPCLALIFNNFKAGKLIFEEWRTRFGKMDREHTIRIAIITGIDKKNPAAYAVKISKKIEDMASNHSTQIMMISRINRMDVTDPINLKRFLNAYEQTQTFVLAPMSFPKSGSPEIATELGILKSKLVVREAWEIGENDDDMVILKPGDDPIIPDGTLDAPIIQALKRLKRMGR